MIAKKDIDKIIKNDHLPLDKENPLLRIEKEYQTPILPIITTAPRL